MKVVFLEEVEGTARVGEVKNVANGFARNYLLPRRLAAPATDHFITIAQARAEKEARRQVRLDEEATKYLLPKVEGKVVTIEVRVGEQGKLFGSVTSRDIAEALQAATGIELEHRQVDLREPIRDLGAHEVTVKLTRSVQALVTVNVEPLGGLAAEEAPAEAEAPEVTAEAPEQPEPEAVEEPEAEAEEPEEAEEAEEPEEAKEPAEAEAEETEEAEDEAEEPAEAEEAEEPEETEEVEAEAEEEEAGEGEAEAGPEDQSEQPKDESPEDENEASD